MANILRSANRDKSVMRIRKRMREMDSKRKALGKDYKKAMKKAMQRLKKKNRKTSKSKKKK